MINHLCFPESRFKNMAPLYMGVVGATVKSHGGVGEVKKSVGCDHLLKWRKGLLLVSWFLGY